jgi:CHASE3 domain sensor protein/putative methionine-R-sulfoxide reductase with GAF domain
MLLISIGVGLTWYNKNIMEKNVALRKQTEDVKSRWDKIFGDQLRRMDMGLRGYALTRGENVLSPYNDAKKEVMPNLEKIDSLLAVQHLDTLREDFKVFKDMAEEFLKLEANQKQLIDEGKIDEFVAVLKADKGKDLWNIFSPMLTVINNYEAQLVEQADNAYDKAQQRTVIVQFIIFFFSIPLLAIVVFRLRRDARNRKELLLEFERNNRSFMFDSGEPLPDDNPQVIIKSSIQNLKRASSFVKEISVGNYSANWDGLNDQNIALNQENLAGDLIKMRDQMKRVKEEDEKRIWTTEGLAKFSDVARTNQDNIEKLSNEVVRFLSKYLNAQQATLFVLDETDPEDQFLNLVACYAFDKKKFVQKRIEIGSGLVGQAYLEGTTNVLTKIPSNYITITSGLGDATPSCLIIVPMKYNEKVEAILELASFNRFEEHQIGFLEKAGEVIASAIYSTKINERTSRLLKESQEQAEVLKAQEEELRQNMEELQATQESMRRRETEYS